MKKKFLLSLAIAFGLAGSVWADLTQVNGVYQIGTAQDLAAFASLVNQNNTTYTSANAVLTADIDMSTLASWTAIGDWNTGGVSSAYKGHFDGQGHTITNFTFTSNKNYFGIFGVISTGALIENFSISGQMTLKHSTGGVVGYARDATPTISNIHSHLNITSNKDAIKPGGILGTSVNGTIIIENCTYSGTINAGGHTGNIGGIVGYVNNNSAAILNVTNCLFDGVIQNGTGTGECGGIIGFNNSGTVTIKNCLSIGTVTSGVAGQFFGILKAGNSTYVGNNYYVGAVAQTGSGQAKGTAPVKVNEADARFASGEFCYLLNGSISGVTDWYQTLGTDEFPTPYGTSLVYAVNQHCDGAAKSDNTSYTNDPLSIVKDNHVYDDGFCSYCGALDETYMFPSEGYYEINTPAKLKWFSAWVNSSSDNNSSNAKLTDDVDMTSIAATWVPIGDWHTGGVTSAYKGHFDGQGHEISNFNVTTSQDYYGIFGVVSAATIENFRIRGFITNNDYSHIGVIGYTRDATSTIRNIQSYLTITNNGNNKNVGGILGSGNSGTTNIDRCAFFGTINAKNKANAGGIVGYFANGNASIVNITNCLFNGNISSENNTSNCGGIAGYGGANVNNVKIKNCLSLGTLDADIYGQFFGKILNVGSSITNCYYQGDNINGTGSSTLTAVDATAVTAEQLAAGEVAYSLNESTNAGMNWYQTLPASPSGDAVPTLDSTHGLVYVNGNVCPDTNAPQGSVSYSNTPGTTIGEHNYNGGNGFCIYCDTFNPDAFSPVDGCYQIANGTQLRWFAFKVNAGTNDANAKLMNDIDMNGVTWTPIGIGTGNTSPGADGYSGTPYTGTFDGQRYSITNFNAEGAGHLGLFGDANGATIKNFSISGSLTITEGYAGGAIAFPINSTIENVHSALVVSVPNSGTHHVGGVVGSSRGGNTINKCSFNGSLTVAAGSTDCFAGIVGYVTSSDEVKNCANYGGVTFSEKNCGIGGIVGYLNDNSVSIKNCLNTGSVHFSGDGSPKFGGAIVGRLRTHNAENITNHYWLEGSAYGAAKDNDGNIILTTAVEADATLLSSGEVAYNLNGDQSDITFYQTIGSDAYPTFNCSHEQVLYVGAVGYTTFYDANKDWELVGDARAYIGSLTPNGGALHLDEIEDIPAGTAVVIGGTYYNKVSTDASATTTGNILLGSDGTVSGGDGIYALAKKNDVVGFYPVKNTVTIPAGKAYLNTAAGVKGLVFEFGEENETAIGSIQNSKFKIQNGEVYNLAGQKLSKLQKGINIVGDKKILK